MNELLASALSAWESFYVIVGSSAGALTGLQFVVIALIAETEMRASFETIGAFGSPTVVHFSTVLWISALLSAPWRTLGGVSVLLALTGLAGIVYVIIVNRRAHAQTGYKAVLEDWIFHVALPFVSYVLLVASAVALAHHTVIGLFAVGATTLILIFVGIHNAWDTVTFIVVNRANARHSDETRAPPDVEPPER